jgi:hypothetical protein
MQVLLQAPKLISNSIIITAKQDKGKELHKDLIKILINKSRHLEQLKEDQLVSKFKRLEARLKKAMTQKVELLQ